MATDIDQKEVGMHNTAQCPLITEKNEIEFTPEQRYILRQVYQLILGWRNQRLQTAQTTEQDD